MYGGLPVVRGHWRIPPGLSTPCDDSFVYHCPDYADRKQAHIQSLFALCKVPDQSGGGALVCSYAHDLNTPQKLRRQQKRLFFLVLNALDCLMQRCRKWRLITGHGLAFINLSSGAGSAGSAGRRLCGTRRRLIAVYGPRVLRTRSQRCHNYK